MQGSGRVGGSPVFFPWVQGGLELPLPPSLAIQVCKWIGIRPGRRGEDEVFDRSPLKRCERPSCDDDDDDGSDGDDVLSLWSREC